MLFCVEVPREREGVAVVVPLLVVEVPREREGVTVVVVPLLVESGPVVTRLLLVVRPVEPTVPVDNSLIIPELPLLMVVVVPRPDDVAAPPTVALPRPREFTPSRTIELGVRVV